jgi:hypothetical protein
VVLVTAEIVTNRGRGDILPLVEERSAADQHEGRLVRGGLAERGPARLVQLQAKGVAGERGAAGADGDVHGLALAAHVGPQGGEGVAPVAVVTGDDVLNVASGQGAAGLAFLDGVELGAVVALVGIEVELGASPSSTCSAGRRGGGARRGVAGGGHWDGAAGLPLGAVQVARGEERGWEVGGWPSPLQGATGRAARVAPGWSNATTTTWAEATAVSTLDVGCANV